MSAFVRMLQTEHSSTETPMSNVDTPASLVGSDVLSLVTAGMYDNPLAIYREYIQNSADALANANGKTNGKVEILIDPVALRVKIRDNGPGLSHEAAGSSAATHCPKSEETEYR